MSTPISTVMRRRLLLGGNVIARRVLDAGLRKDANQAHEDLRAALWHLVGLAACLQHHHPARKIRRKRP